MTILAQLELNESAEVDFGIEIHGTSEASSEIRFIIEGPQYGILCRCTDANGVITASIPKLKGILPAGTFDARLEVVVDGKFFTPLKESIEFKPMVEFDVTSARAKPVQSMKVETKNIRVRVAEKEPETVAEAAPIHTPQMVEVPVAAPIMRPVAQKPATIQVPRVAPTPPVQQLPVIIEESWEESVEQRIDEIDAPVIPKKKKPNPRAKELYAKIVALKEQMSSLKK